MRSCRLFCYALIAMVCLAGCSATTTFIPYPAKINTFMSATPPASQEDFAKILISERSSNDKILYNLEHGRLAQIYGFFDLSRADFALAIDTIKENEERATVSVSAIGANLAALATNDNALPYEGEGYERVLLHHYQAMNYLFKNNLEGAGVEFRWANAEQDEALKRHEHEIAKAQKRAAESNLPGDPMANAAFSQEYAQLSEVAGRVKNSFQNAYSFYLSGLIYELQGELNDAYIDYKKALEIYPENRYLQHDALRLAKVLKMSDEFTSLAARFPGSAQQLQSKKDLPDSGELIVFYEDGSVPAREEVKLAFPLSSGITTIALPFYRIGWSNHNPLLLESNGQSLGVTEPICDIRTLAVKSLYERMPAVLTRQLVRAVAKGAAQKELKERLGAFGQLATMAYSILSENADLRSWLTLPETAQLIRIRLPFKKLSLELKHPATTAFASVEVEIRPKGKTILHVVRQGDDFHVTSVVF